MRDTVIVFARAPRLGAVKRRLAAAIGERAALRFHRATLTALLRTLAADRRFTTVVAVTPDRGPMPRPVRIRRRDQGQGDLGRRLGRTVAAYPRRRIVIVGSDIPAVTASDIAAAFRALGSADAVLGPAEDGGYWLVAFGPRRPARPFRAVRWSSEHALADTRANFAGRRVALLRTLRDVDTIEDLSALGLARAYAPIRPRV
jgi:rSAM/selenodomain-associated transferase 1